MKALPPEEAARVGRVEASGVVTYVGQACDRLFLQEGEVGLYVEGEGAFASCPALGDSARLRGRVVSGRFAPHLTEAEVLAVKPATLPPAIWPSANALYSGSYDGTRVAVEGVVEAAESASCCWVYRTRLGGDLVRVMLQKRAGEQAPLLEHARVRVIGVASTVPDEAGGTRGGMLFVPDTAHVEVLVPASEEVRVQSVQALQRYNPALRGGRRVAVRGVVTYEAGRGWLVVQDGPGALSVIPLAMPQLAIGDSVEVRGYVRSTAGTLTMTSAEVLRLGPGELPPAQPLTVGDFARRAGRGDRVRVTGRVVSGLRDGRALRLLLEADSVLFEAYVEGGAVGTLPPRGSAVQLEGVAMRAPEGVPLASHGGAKGRLAVLLQSGEDLLVLEQPEPWVPRWVWITLLVLVALLGVGLAWNAILRGRVRAQTRTIEDQLNEMRYLKDAAEAASRAKSAFLADMSHEIRTPLTAIIGFAQVLGEEAEPQDREYAQLIEHAGLRLMDSINSVLHYARMEAGRVPLSLQALPVARHVADALGTLTPLARGKGLTLTLDVAPEAERAYAALDPGGFGRVLNNLVGNAIKFTTEGGVRVSVQAPGTQVRIRVEDTGPGIGEAFLPRLFGEFQQESTDEERAHHGSGLGLAITRRLVQAMGGTIGVDSVVGEGTAFTLTFPQVAPPD